MPTEEGQLATVAPRALPSLQMDGEDSDVEEWETTETYVEQWEWMDQQDFVTWCSRSKGILKNDAYNMWLDMQNDVEVQQRYKKGELQMFVQTQDLLRKNRWTRKRKAPIEMSYDKKANDKEAKVVSVEDTEVAAVPGQSSSVDGGKETATATKKVDDAEKEDKADTHKFHV